MSVKITKPLPEELKQFNGFNTFEDCVMAISLLAQRATGRKFLVGTRRSYYGEHVCVVKNNVISEVPNAVNTNNYIPLIDNGWGCSSDVQLLYVDEDGDVWKSRLSVVTKNGFRHNLYTSTKEDEVTSFGMENWSLVTKCDFDYRATIINSIDQIDERFERKNKYAHAFFKEKSQDANNEPMTLVYGLIHPELEQLSKADYEFADNLLTNPRIEKTDWAEYSRLCKHGTSLKDIFKTSSVVYKSLKNVSDLSIWDLYRKMAKTGKIKNSDEIEKVNKSNFGRKELTEINSILNASHNGKPIFTMQSLLNYINRLDTYEAITAVEALPLLQDYLGCCKTIGIEPRVDGDSLKREHDIAARMSRELRQKEYESQYEKGFKDACQKLSVFDYTENTFSIRAIRDIDDLYDEAKQQHNCLAGYISRIQSGDAKVFVMRNNNNPDKSLITVSIDKMGGRYILTQSLKAYNQPIRNKSQLEFLNRWINYVNRCANA